MLSPRRTPRRPRRPSVGRRVASASAALVAALVTVTSGPVRADDSVTDGVRTLTVSKSVDLSGDGEKIVVTGSGYDESKGVYVGLCVITSPDEQPSPCGGGIDRAGASGASEWISSNPPSYAIGLPIPYGPGGSFSVELSVSPTINEVVDCRAVRCAIVTKNDHTIIDDRSQDLIIPVTFTGTAPTTTTTGPETSVAPIETAPEITVADDVADLAAVAEGDESGGSFPVLLTAAVVLGLAGLGVVLLKRRPKTNDR